MNVVWWLGEDLRLQDNAILHFIASHKESVAIVWTPSTSFLRAKAHRRAHYLAALEEFRKSLASIGGKLFGNSAHHASESWLKNFCKEHHIQKVYKTRSWGSEELSLENVVLSWGLHFEWIDHNALFEWPFASDVVAPEVPFSKWRRRAEQQLSSQVRACHSLSRVQFMVASEQQVLPTQLVDTKFLHPKVPQSETHALTHLHAYFDSQRPQHYRDTRNGLIEWSDSTKLSPHLALGQLSPKQVLHELHVHESRYGTNDSTKHIALELLWREYFRQVLAHQGVKTFNLKARYPTKSMQEQENLFTQWANGKTGEPFIDANMQEFNATGWMSNRGRQNVASYLTKTMGVDWQRGAEFFEQHLIDYDVHSNWGNWAYVAGVGQDPRDRIFNPKLQAQMYDPHGSYQKMWNKKDR